MAKVAIASVFIATFLALAACGPKTGILDISSKPPGATVTVDGQALGTTPCLEGDVAPGEHEISLSLEEYEPVTRTATVTAGETLRLNFPLTRQMGGIKVPKTYPMTTEIFLNGEKIGWGTITLTDLEPGNYRLKFSNPGYITEERQVVVVAGKSIRVEVDLEENPYLDWTFDAGAPIATPIVFSGLNAFAATGNMLYIINVPTGQEYARVNLSKYEPYGGTHWLKVSGSMVYVMMTNRVIAVDISKAYTQKADAGDVAWNIETCPGPVFPHPVLSESLIFYTDEYNIYCASARNGVAIWSLQAHNVFDRNVTVRLLGVADDLLLIEAKDSESDAPSRLAAINFGAELQWETEAGLEPIELAILGDRLFFEKTGHVVCLDSQTGTEYWRFPLVGRLTATPVGVRHIDSRVYFADQSAFYALDAASGKQIGSLSSCFFSDAGGKERVTVLDMSEAEGRMDRAFTVANRIAYNLLYVTIDNNLYGVDERTGEIEWSFSLDQPASARPVVHGGWVYVPGDDGVLQALEERWRLPAGGAPAMEKFLGKTWHAGREVWDEYSDRYIFNREYYGYEPAPGVEVSKGEYVGRWRHRGHVIVMDRGNWGQSVVSPIVEHEGMLAVDIDGITFWQLGSESRDGGG